MHASRLSLNRHSRTVLGKVIEQLRGKIPSDGSVKGITLIKGVDVRGADIHIFADVIERELGVSCSSLSGANIADEGERETRAKVWVQVFSTLTALAES